MRDFMRVKILVSSRLASWANTLIFVSFCDSKSIIQATSQKLEEQAAYIYII